MDHKNATVKLITDINPQSQLFIKYVEKNLGLNIDSLSPTAYYQHIPAEGKTLILLDADHVNDRMMHHWLGIASEYGDDMVLAAFNIKNEDHATQLLTTLHLQGIFYRTDSLDLICKGIDRLLSDELWMTRHLMNRLITFYRRQQLNLYRPACGLTNRELEIISLLSNGSSNTEIADQLFVSEHTVKSHLYNIFKKIKVHNRIQAMNWARDNLGLAMVYSNMADENNKAVKHQSNHC